MHSNSTSNPDGARPSPEAPDSEAAAERRRLEQELWQSHQRFQTLAQYSWDILSILDAEGLLVYNSPACERIHGFAPAELQGRSTVDFIHPEDRSRVAEAMSWLMAHPGEPVSVEYRFACKDGRWVWMEAVGVNHLDNPAVQGIVANSRDITGRKRAEEAHQAAEEMYRELLERQGEGFGMVDAEERFLFANPVAEAIFGVSPGKLVGRCLLDFLDEPERQIIRLETRQRQTGQANTYELDICRPSGERRTILVTATPRASVVGQSLQVIGVFRDITEARAAERTLQDERERLSQIFHGSHDAIFLTNLETGHFLDVNKAFERITGYSREQVLGGISPGLNLWFDPADRQAYFEEMQAQGVVHNRLIRIRHREGREVWAECNSSPLTLGGEPCVVSTARDVTERIRTEAALRESEQTFQRLLEVASVPIGVANARGEIEYLNPRFLQDFKYSREELPTMEAWWALAFPDPAYRKQGMEAWQVAQDRAAQRGGEVAMDQVFHVTCGDGQVRQVEIRGAISGSRVIAFFQDLTERAQAEAVLRDALEFSDRMLTAQPLGVVAFHAASGRCIRANEAMARMIGATVDQLLQQNFREMASWKTYGLFEAAERALATEQEQRLQTHVMTTFGRDCWLSLFFSVFRAGGDLHLLVLSEDITGRRTAEVALSKATTAVEQSPAAIVITDTQGTIEYVNAAFTRSTGYSFEEVVGRNPRLLKSGKQAPELYQDLWATVLTGQTWLGQFCNRRKDGTLFWEQATISPLRDEKGEITHLVASKLDITDSILAAQEHRKLEEQVAKTQKLESLGSLAGGVAHDMNNVLGAILGLASIHQEIQPVGTPLRRDMDAIVKACQRGGALVKGLLGFARKGLAEAEDVDLNSLVRDEVALLSRTTLQRVQLVMELAEGLPVVRGDASALSHALMNLCVNAVDAMEGGGTLTMRTFAAEPGFIGLEVSDSGCGMPKEVQDKALDPFFTTKPQGKGTGLGLPIVYGTVKAHQGRMEIDSVPGQGTSVKVFLPAQARPEPPSPPSASTGQPLRSLYLLVVDDDDLVRDSVVQMLEALGHGPAVATSGEEALALLKAGQPADLVILDLNMPGLGGAAALPLIRDLRPGLPVLLATGRVDQVALDLVQSIPGVSLLPKPFSFSEVKQCLRPHCGG